VELEDDGDLELAGAQHLKRVLGLGVGEDQLDVGMALAEAGERRGQQRRARGGERRQAHPAPAHSGDRVELCLGGGQAGQHDLGVVHERPARIGEANAATGAVDEGGPGALLERRDLLRDRRLGVGQSLRGGREGALLRDRLQDSQLLDVEHNPSLSKPAEVRI
jgi:hypothetical protein